MSLILMMNAFGQVMSPQNSLGNSNTKLIARAQQYYSAGRIDDSEHLALKIITDDNHLTKYEKYNVYRLLAFCSIAADNEEAGKRHFISAIRFNPNMSADPLTWSPKLRKVFDLATSEVKRQRLREAEWVFASEASLGRRASLKSLYLPGAGQLMKHQKRRGMMLGILTFSTVSAYLYGQAYLPKVKDRYHEANSTDLAEKRWKEYRDTRYMVSLIGLTALAIYGYTFFDALWAESDGDAVKLPIENIEHN